MKLYYNFFLPNAVIQGLRQFETLTYEGECYSREYLALLGKKISHDDMMEYLRKGYPEEAFIKLDNKEEDFKKLLLDIELNANKYNNTSKYPIVYIRSGRKRDYFLIYDKIDCVFYRYSSLSVKEGLGTGNKKGYLYRYFKNNYSQNFKEVNIDTYLASESQLNKILKLKYKYYIVPKKFLYDSTSTGAGQVTSWIDKKDDCPKYKKCNIIDETTGIDPVEINKLFKKD